MKVLAYGFPLDSNFGGPSVAHGLFAALRQWDVHAELVVYQQRPVDAVSVSDMAFPVRYYPYRNRIKRLLCDWIRVCVFGRPVSSPEENRFWEDFRSADVVANIYAICFCEGLAGRGAHRTFIQSFKKLLRDFLPSLLARFSGKTSVKTVSSYGPIVSTGERLAAWLGTSFFFKRLQAREKEGAAQLRRSGVLRSVPVAPDLANLMPFDPLRSDFRPIGFSVSFMSERQWQNDSKTYVACMSGLIRHMRASTGRPVVIFPNQINVPNGRDDVAVAHDVVSQLADVGGVSVFDVRAKGSRALKNALASCEVLVSCRYHACVAALSAAVPVLVLGWHVKYAALMKLYGQDAWLVPSQSCDLALLKRRFSDLWNAREDVRGELMAKGPLVRRETLSSLTWLLTGRGSDEFVSERSCGK